MRASVGLRRTAFSIVDENSAWTSVLDAIMRAVLLQTAEAALAEVYDTLLTAKMMAPARRPSMSTKKEIEVPKTREMPVRWKIP